MTRVQDRPLPEAAWTFRCPDCGHSLDRPQSATLMCAHCGSAFPRLEGIWRLLPAGRARRFSQFIPEYETVRRMEGRGSSDPEYYRALPYKDLSGRMSHDWAIRARSFEMLVERVIAPMERTQGSRLRIVDLGAGNGWLANRLAQRGHDVAAVDLLTNDFDGLGCRRYYPQPFLAVQADFDALPFSGDQAQMIIFSASLHYSTDYRQTLTEALRVLNHGGLLVALDSPIYRDPESGRRMVHEREMQFEIKYGFRSDGLKSEHFLTDERLKRLEAELHLQWQAITPDFGLRWRARPWLARLRGGREPAQFRIITTIKS